MEAKGLVCCRQVGKCSSYTPTVKREQAVIAETLSFLNRVYQGNMGLMVSAMAECQELSYEGIA